MNAPLFGLLFTDTEKKLIYSILHDISLKNNFGINVKDGFFPHLTEKLGLVEVKCCAKDISENAIDNKATVSIVSGWSEDKKILLKGLVIDLLCYNENLNKAECLAAIAFLDSVGLENQSIKNIIKALP